MWENVWLTNMILSDNWVKELQKTESSDWDGYKTGQLMFKMFENGRSKGKV